MEHTFTLPHATVQNGGNCHERLVMSATGVAHETLVEGSGMCGGLTVDPTLWIGNMTAVR